MRIFSAPEKSLENPRADYYYEALQSSRSGARRPDLLRQTRRGSVDGARGARGGWSACTTSSRRHQDGLIITDEFQKDCWVRVANPTADGVRVPEQAARHSARLSHRSARRRRAGANRDRRRGHARHRAHSLLRQGERRHPLHDAAARHHIHRRLHHHGMLEVRRELPRFRERAR